MGYANPAALSDDATTTAATGAAGGATIRAAEARHFGTLAGDWWDPSGSSAMLHRLNPVRLAYLREAMERHWGFDVAGRTPLAGRTALDVGCGAGLLAEPLARLGAAVTAIDAAPENIAAARIHAEAMGVAVDYRAGELGHAGLGTFDLVTAMEVIEHVADKAVFVRELAARLAPAGDAGPGSLLVISTPNRTATSRLLLAGAAEWIGMIPRGTHRARDFVTPDELRGLLAEAGLEMGTPTGIAWRPGRGLHLSRDLSLNYIVTARRR